MLNLIEHTHSLARSLLETEIRGIKVDLGYAFQCGEELLAEKKQREELMHSSAVGEIREIEEELWEAEKAKRKTEKGKANVKRPVFNFLSSPQKGRLLFEKLGLPGIRKKKTGNWDTSKAVIEDISNLHPVAEHITRYNQVNVYYNTVVKGIITRAINDRIFPEFNVIGTKQGRISHSNPNMGNMPARDPEWNKLRGIFLPDPGFVFNCLDYGQIEVCVAAHYSGDSNLLKIVCEGASQHDITAESLSIPRFQAKTLNFSMQYGAGPGKISRMLDCSFDEAKKVFDQYWSTYAGQRNLQQECLANVEAGRPIVNLIGRKRHFRPGKRDPWDPDYRRGYSALIQSTAADITNRAFYLVDAELKQRGWGCGAWTVHDELITMVQKERAEEAYQLTSEIMLRVGTELGLSVPLKVDGKEGLKRWEK